MKQIDYAENRAKEESDIQESVQQAGIVEDMSDEYAAEFAGLQENYGTSMATMVDHGEAEHNDDRDGMDNGQRREQQQKQQKPRKDGDDDGNGGEVTREQQQQQGEAITPACVCMCVLPAASKRASRE